MPGPLPGAVHDLAAARIWGIVRELADAGFIVLADTGYIGAGEHVLTPYRGRNKPASQKAANSAHARPRAPGTLAAKIARVHGSKYLIIGHQDLPGKPRRRRVPAYQSPGAGGRGSEEP